MRAFLRVVTCLLLVGCLALLTYFNITKYDDMVQYSAMDSGFLTVNDDMTSYTIVDDNIVKCDLNTVSQVIHAMEADGYVIAQDLSEASCRDVILSQNNISVRVRYLDGVMTSLGSPYDYSSTPLQYLK